MLDNGGLEIKLVRKCWKLYKPTSAGDYISQRAGILISQRAVWLEIKLANGLPSWKLY